MVSQMLPIEMRENPDFLLQQEMIRSLKEIRKTPWFSSGNGEAFGLGHISFESLRESQMPENFVADRGPNQDRRRLSLYCLRGGTIKIKKSSIGEKFAKMHLLFKKMIDKYFWKDLFKILVYFLVISIRQNAFW